MTKSKKNIKGKKKPVTKPDKSTRARDRAVIWTSAFLKTLAKNGNVTEACKAAKIQRSTAYEYKELHEDFEKEWNNALEQACDSLEQEAFRRARDGVLKPVFQGGEEVGQIREYSDTLMIVLLKAHRPEKFRERMDMNVSGKNGQNLESTINLIVKDQSEIFNNLSRNGYNIAEAA